MRLSDLLAGVPHRWLRGPASGAEPDVTLVTHDSRKAGPGAVFAALRGLKDDGLRFAPDALARGAAVLVVAAGRATAVQMGGWDRVVEVDDDRIALAVLSRRLHGSPDEALTMVGVTGTNGKTTTCRLIAAVLEAAGVHTGLLGTVGHRMGDGSFVPAERTTPEASDLHALLARMRDTGCGACVMEVSSHALDLGRVHGIGFDVAVFTNLTRDHLDYHKDMESYFEVKQRLLDGLEAGAAAAINADDPYGRRLMQRLSARAGGPKVVSWGEASDASVRLASLKTGPRGSRLDLREAGASFVLDTPLAGRPNASNVMAAAAAARALGIGWDAVTRGVAAVQGVDGRMERVVAGTADQAGPGFEVYVDYAHTDDALRGLLETVRPITAGRVILVFGCGGDRDRTKRPLMGAHAARLADVVHVTSDNPRTEPPQAIVDEILAGADAVPQAERRPGLRLEADVDRSRAIHAAIAEARPGDTVVIAGKGHETTQILGSRVIPFDDRELAREALRRRMEGSSHGA
ncbi:MAG: UDP-N-acetylmuramoyl-L-alanyl-D-glutamate--2,6-diaminopimelate ligase [Candidatus Polarisedimenticolia bacterium]